MILLDVTWAKPVNILTIECRPCGITFRRPSNYSNVRCPKCNVIEMWHNVDPKPTDGDIFTAPVMQNKVFPDGTS